MLRTKNCSHAAFVAVVALCVSGAACQADTQQATLDVDSLEKRVQSDGAQALVTHLYEKPEDWTTVRQSIAVGSARWLSLGVALYRGADGGAKSMLAASLGESLETSASSMLRVATQENLSTDVFCIAPDVDDDRFGTYEAAMQSINARISAVTRVAAPELAATRSTCLRSLTNSQAQLAKFFGR